MSKHKVAISLLTSNLQYHNDRVRRLKSYKGKSVKLESDLLEHKKIVAFLKESIAKLKK